MKSSFKEDVWELVTQMLPVLAALFLVLTLFLWKQYDTHKRRLEFNMEFDSQQVTAVVQSVRIIAPTNAVQEKGNAVAGAVVGGLLFKAPGAIVGAAVGEGNHRVVVNQKVEQCSVVLKTDDNLVTTWVFDDNEFDSSSVARVALFLPGDHVTLWKFVSRTDPTDVTFSWNEVGANFRKKPTP